MHLLPRIASAFAFIAVLVALTPAPSALAQDNDGPVMTAENVFVADGFVYYNLRENRTVGDEERTKTNWDVMINGVEFHPNRAGLLLDAGFDAVAEAPLEGMSTGMMTTDDGDTWYNYDMNDHLITPKAAKTFVLQLPDDQYAKIEVMSYYHRITEDPRYLTFRYSLADSETRAFVGTD